MNLEEFTSKTFKNTDFNLRPRIVCNDGFTMSVQGHDGAYSSPRGDSRLYIEMEIGFPSDKEDLIMSFAECKTNPTNTVYGYVPCEIIQKVIDNHGGIDIEKTLNRC